MGYVSFREGNKALFPLHFPGGEVALGGGGIPLDSQDDLILRTHCYSIPCMIYTSGQFIATKPAGWSP